MGIKQTLQKTMYKSAVCLKRNSPTILTVIAAVGVVGTTVAAIKATPKAMKLLEKASDEKNDELTKLEVVKIAAPVYIPTVVIGVSTIACMFGANALNRKQQAALVSAYALVSNSYKEYKDKLKELYGEEAHQNIVDSIVKEKAKDVKISSESLCCMSSLDVNEDESAIRLFYDEFSQRYFESTLAKVVQAEYHLNRNFNLRQYCDVNEWYDFLGLPRTGSEDYIGWSAYKFYEDGMESWIEFNHREVQLDDGLTCIVIEFPIEPIIDFLDDEID